MATPEQPSRCHDHPERESRVLCSSCRRTLCDDCFRFRLGGRPACARCAYEVNTRPQRRVSLAVSFVGFGLGAGAWALRRYALWERSPLYVVGAALAVISLAVWLAWTARDPALPPVANRAPGEDADADFEAAGSPFRAGARRFLMAASPRVSGKATALLVGACMVASAALLPRALHLPRWVAYELVLGAWWLVTASTLVVLLYRGWRLLDDYVYFLPWNKPEKPTAALPGGGVGTTVAERSGAKSSGWGSGGCSGIDGCSGADAEGLIAVLVVGVFLVVALGAAWIFVEVAAPLLFFAMYALLMRALGRVANDKHECEGELGKALGWGALWATVYLAPLGVLTWLFHLLHRASG